MNLVAIELLIIPLILSPRPLDCGKISDESGIQFTNQSKSSSDKKQFTNSFCHDYYHPRLNESWTRISDAWDYDHQDNWPLTCSGNHQSPVDLQNICVQSKPTVPVRTIHDPSLKLFLYHYDYLLQPNSLRITNNGHTVQVVLRHSSTVNQWAPKVSGSACNFDVYQFRQLHFHWHQNDRDGSEHAIHGQRGAVEMHMVHFNTKYNNFNHASSYPDGLLVLGVLFKATSDSVPSSLLQPVMAKLKSVAKYRSSVLMSSPIRLRTFLPRNINSYYKYTGSLTTPPCSESVTWLIFSTMVDMSLDQLEKFDMLDNKENQWLTNTNRRLQQLNDRFVYISNIDHCRKQLN